MITFTSDIKKFPWKANATLRTGRRVMARKTVLINQCPFRHATFRYTVLRWVDRRGKTGVCSLGGHSYCQMYDHVMDKEDILVFKGKKTKATLLTCSVGPSPTLAV